MSKKRLETGIKQLRSGLDNCCLYLSERKLKQMEDIIGSLAIRLKNYENWDKKIDKEEYEREW